MSDAAKYLSLDVRSEANAAPFVKCAVRLPGIDKRKGLCLRRAVRGAVSERAPKFRYADRDIQSIETGRGTGLPLAILDDPISYLGQLFGKDEKWHIVVTIAPLEASAARPKATTATSRTVPRFSPHHHAASFDAGFATPPAACEAGNQADAAITYFYDTLELGAEKVSESVASLFACSPSEGEDARVSSGGRGN